MKLELGPLGEIRKMRCASRLRSLGIQNLYEAKEEEEEEEGKSIMKRVKARGEKLKI